MRIDANQRKVISNKMNDRKDQVSLREDNTIKSHMKTLKLGGNTSKNQKIYLFVR